MVFTGFDPFNTILAGYMPADQDTGGTSFYGYLDKDGNWYIMKTVRTGNELAHTYAKGTSGYPAAWIARATQTYAAFDVTF